MGGRKVHPRNRRDIYAQVSTEELDVIIHELTEVMEEEAELARQHNQDRVAAQAWRSWAMEVRDDRRKQKSILDWLSKRSIEYFDGHQPPWYDPRIPQSAGKKEA